MKEETKELHRILEKYDEEKKAGNEFYASMLAVIAFSYTQTKLLEELGIELSYWHYGEKVYATVGEVIEQIEEYLLK